MKLTRRGVAASLGAVVLLVAGLTLSMSGTALSLITGTTTQSDGALVTGTGNFTYDGQTVATSAWPNMGNADNGKLQWVKTPLTFDCANGTLKVSDKKEFTGGPLTYTFTVGAGSDPAVPAGSVIVGVLIHSGIDFNIESAAWVTDGSAVTIKLDKSYSNAAVFYCTPVTTTTTTGTTGTTTTTPGTTTVVTTTVTTPGGTTTITTPGGTTTITTPARTVTTTVPGATVTTPGATLTNQVAGPTVTQTVTQANTVTNTSTVTVPGATSTVTTPGKTVTVTHTKTVPKLHIKIVQHTVTKTKVVKVPAKPLRTSPTLAHTR